MGIVKKSSGPDILAGEKLRFSILDAEEVTGEHGPQVQFSLRVLDGAYRGEEIREWAKIGEDEDSGEQYIAEGGKLFNITLAAFGGDTKKIDSFDSIADVLEALVGKSFVSITKSRGKNGDFVGITWDMVYVD
jgi:hypothetical protein